MTEMHAVDLRRLMTRLPEPPKGAFPPSWDYWRRDLYLRVTAGNPPEEFMTWACIFHTMLVNHWNMHAQFAELYLGLNRWEKAIKIKWNDLHVDKHSYTNYSMNLIHQCYHLKQWEDVTGKKVGELDTILDFGAGYGAMALIINRLGFKGEYIIYDLPEFSLLQQWYLGKQGTENVRWFTDANELKGYCNNYDLMIAIWSLSETPFRLRREFLRKMDMKSFLFMYWLKFMDLDNAGWFDNFIQRHLEYKWNVVDDKYIPGGNRYAIGW